MLSWKTKRADWWEGAMSTLALCIGKRKGINVTYRFLKEQNKISGTGAKNRLQEYSQLLCWDNVSFMQSRLWIPLGSAKKIIFFNIIIADDDYTTSFSKCTEAVKNIINTGLSSCLLFRITFIPCHRKISCPCLYHANWVTAGMELVQSR